MTTWIRLAPLALALVAGVAQAAPATYKVDQAHSTVGFTVRHLMVSDVNGVFKDFDGSFVFDSEKATVSDATFTVKTASIDTNNDKRDDHLRSADFFESSKFPTMTVTNSKVKKAGKNKYKWTGDLTIRDVTKPVTFDLVYTGTTKDGYGNEKAGFAANTTIKRGDYGLKWNKALEAGGVTVSDEVRINLDIQAQKEKTAATTAEAPAAAAPAAQPTKKQ